MFSNSIWAYVDPLTVEQAARLWNNHDPSIHESGPGTPQEIRSGIAAIIQLLSGGFASGEFPADPRNHLEAIGNFRVSCISRESLRAFAAKRNLRPPFLFDSVLGSAISESSAAVTTEEVKNRGGRPEEYDWDAMLGEIIRIANLDGLPDSQAELVKQLLDWFDRHFDKEPSESSVKKRVSAFLEMHRRAIHMKDKNPSD